jgi:hypothetical protein
VSRLHFFRDTCRQCIRKERQTTDVSSSLVRSDVGARFCRAVHHDAANKVQCFVMIHCL